MKVGNHAVMSKQSTKMPLGFRMQEFMSLNISETNGGTGQHFRVEVLAKNSYTQFTPVRDEGQFALIKCSFDIILEPQHVACVIDVTWVQIEERKVRCRVAWPNVCVHHTDMIWIDRTQNLTVFLTG
eukprot:scaffold39187_cov168-Amphora_coffeaeformis.AAC.2